MTYLKPLALVLLGAASVWWGLAPRIDRQADRADRAETSLADAERMISLQAGVLAEQQRQIGQVTELDRQFRKLTQNIHQNAADHAAAIEELKRHDQEVADYLRSPVPAALGRLYERPETTDPRAYCMPTGVPAGGVPAAGAASAAAE
jgi:LysB family phage lysis regulatory protein